MNQKFHQINKAAIPPQWTATADLDGARLLRLPAVSERVGLRRSAIYELVKGGKFPRPVKAGGASLWIDHEVTAWICGLAAARNA